MTIGCDTQGPSQSNRKVLCRLTATDEGTEALLAEAVAAPKKGLVKWFKEERIEAE